MSETKHTPLPWQWEFLPEDHGYETLIGTGGFRVLMHSGEYGPVKEQDQELIVTSVNARPKVEELVKAAKACVPIAENAGLGPPGPTTDQEDAKRLERAIREVEAALKGKAPEIDLEAHERDLERRAGCEDE